MSADEENGPPLLAFDKLLPFVQLSLVKTLVAEQQLGESETKPLRPTFKAHSGVLGFIDINGMTGFAANMTVDAFRMLINSVFGRIVDIVFEHGGEVCKYAGDAMFVTWACDEVDADYHNALASSINCMAALLSLEFDSNLTLRSYMTLGRFSSAHVGARGRWEYFQLGEARLELINMTRDAPKISSSCTLSSAFHNAVLQRTGTSSSFQFSQIGGFYQMTDVRQWRMLPVLQLGGNSEQSLKESFANLTESQQCQVLESMAMSRLEATYQAEKRSVSVMFARVYGLDESLSGKIQSASLATFQGLAELTMDSIHEHTGQLRQLIWDDKGLVIMCTIGLSTNGAGVMDPTRHSIIGLAHTLMKKNHSFGASASIGCARGNNFCGIIGSSRRCEFGLMGLPTILAARLMCAAKPGTILCDSQTALFDLKYTSLLRNEGFFTPKGFNRQVAIYSLALEQSPDVFSSSQQQQQQQVVNDSPFYLRLPPSLPLPLPLPLALPLAVPLAVPLALAPAEEEAPEKVASLGEFLSGLMMKTEISPQFTCLVVGEGLRLRNRLSTLHKAEGFRCTLDASLGSSSSSSSSLSSSSSSSSSYVYFVISCPAADQFEPHSSSRALLFQALSKLREHEVKEMATRKSLDNNLEEFLWSRLEGCANAPGETFIGPFARWLLLLPPASSGDQSTIRDDGFAGLVTACSKLAIDKKQIHRNIESITRLILAQIATIAQTSDTMGICVIEVQDGRHLDRASASLFRGLLEQNTLCSICLYVDSAAEEAHFKSSPAIASVAATAANRVVFEEKDALRLIKARSLEFFGIDGTSEALSDQVVTNLLQFSNGSIEAVDDIFRFVAQLLENVEVSESKAGFGYSPQIERVLGFYSVGGGQIVGEIGAADAIQKSLSLVDILSSVLLVNDAYLMRYDKLLEPIQFFLKVCSVVGFCADSFSFSFIAKLVVKLAEQASSAVDPHADIAAQLGAILIGNDAPKSILDELSSSGFLLRCNSDSAFVSFASNGHRSAIYALLLESQGETIHAQAANSLTLTRDGGGNGKMSPGCLDALTWHQAAMHWDRAKDWRKALACFFLSAVKSSELFCEESVHYLARAYAVYKREAATFGLDLVHSLAEAETKRGENLDSQATSVHLFFGGDVISLEIVIALLTRLALDYTSLVHLGHKSLMERLDCLENASALYLDCYVLSLVTQTQRHAHVPHVPVEYAQAFPSSIMQSAWLESITQNKAAMFGTSGGSLAIFKCLSGLQMLQYLASLKLSTVTAESEAAATGKFKNIEKMQLFSCTEFVAQSREALAACSEHGGSDTREERYSGKRLPLYTSSELCGCAVW